MKKLLSLLIVLVLLFVSSVSLSENADPIVGAWYVMFDYKDYPPSAETAGKNYMLYMLFFDQSGVISGLSAEYADTGWTASASVVGTWSNADGAYTVNLIGIGSFPAEFSNGRLLVKIAENAWYSMRSMEWSDWYTDIILCFN